MIDVIKENFKTNWVSIIGYAVAFGILASAPFGSLSGPGLFAAVLGIGLALAGKNSLAGTVGVMTAAGSFVAQALTAICPTCTAAATAFALAGVICLLQVLKDKPMLVVSLSAVLVGSLVCFSSQGFFDSKLLAQPTAPKYQIESTVVNGPDGKPTVFVEGKAMLFISTTCPTCKELVPEFIAADPQGLTWQPVVVPVGYLDEGREWLTEAGYTGTVLADRVAPNYMVPSLTYDNQTYDGKSSILQSDFYNNEIN